MTRAQLFPTETATAFFALREKEETLPWYLHAVITVGAWIAAGFFIVFFVAMMDYQLFKAEKTMITVGAIVIAAATAAQRASKATFWSQVCLAFSVAGHVLLFVGIGEQSDTLGAVVLAAVALAAALYVLYDDALHRFLSTLSALALSTVWLHFRMAQPQEPFAFGAEALFDVSLLAHVAGIGLIFVCVDAPRRFVPLGYALIVSLVGMIAHSSVFSFLGFEHRVRVWPATVILSAALLALCFWVANFPREKPRALWVCAGAVILLGAVTTPAILLALALLVLGYGLQERPMLILGALLLPTFIAFYYYDLDLTLAQKSGVLAGSGVVLLALHAVLHRLPGTHSPS